MKKIIEIIGLILVCLLALILSGVGGEYFKGAISKMTTASQTANQKWIDDAGKRYYDTQKKYYDSLSKSLHVTPDKLNITKNFDFAKETMKTCLFQLDKEHCENVIDGTLWIGEPKIWVVNTIGPYTSSRNTTVTKGVTHEQWVYGNALFGGTFVYFDNDVLTAFQNSSNN